MKKFVNGKYFDMTPKEIEEIRKNLPKIEARETIEERMEKLERILTNILPILDRLGVKFE